jgi:uncharacterized protein (DUF1810 family)
MTAPDDPHQLERFVEAQRGSFEAARSELGAGRKHSHWMWFIFPQLKGLGVSAASEYYGLASRSEAEAYWRHPLLGARLKECIELTLRVPDKTAHQIFGSPDDLKFRSSLTLFAEAVPEELLFKTALKRYFSGKADVRTLELLSSR